MGYKAIDQRFWSDDLVLEYFTVIDRIVFIYLLTNGRTAITGCYSDSVYLISQGTGVSREDVKTSLEHLELLGRILWDRETREILLMNYGRYNWNLSPKFVKGAYASAETIRSDNLRSIVADKLNEFVANKSRIPLPRGYDTYGHDNGYGYGDGYGNGYGYGYGSGDGDGTGNGNGVKTEKEADFEKFWAAYPRKVGKPDALKAFVKADVPLDTLLAALDRKKNCSQWQRDNGEFIPYPATWLNREGWNDEEATVGMRECENAGMRKWSSQTPHRYAMPDTCSVKGCTSGGDDRKRMLEQMRKEMRKEQEEK